MAKGRTVADVVVGQLFFAGRAAITFVGLLLLTTIHL